MTDLPSLAESKLWAQQAVVDKEAGRTPDPKHEERRLVIKAAALARMAAFTR
jgi:hypothetical protein